MIEAEDLLIKLNKELGKFGMLEMRLVNPKDLKGQHKNARYFMPEKFKVLVNNIKKGGNLESVPLCVERDGKMEIISGHHRVQAAREAGLDKILVFITPSDISNDELVSKQLSHNSLVGLDDEVILAELFNSIEDISQKIATGINDDICKIDYTSLNFRIGEFKEFTILFMPEDEGYTDEVMTQVAEKLEIKSSSAIRLTNIKYWERFANVIRTIKKCENIKSNGTAFLRMVELAEKTMEQELHKMHT